MNDKVPKKSGRGANLQNGPGKGRPKGALNKTTKQLKDMVLEALDKAGGVAYLAEQARKSPGPFLALVGKVLPHQITGEGGGPVAGELVIRFIHPDDKKKS